MNKPLKTLLLNPPSFENFDGGASSRWPAVREIESYWYPVWLAYPAGLLEGSRLLDAPPHHVSADETIEIAKGYEFLVLFTSTVGWAGDHALAQAIKKANPNIRIAFGESGCGWIPYALDRMDFEWEDRFFDLGLKMKPSDYWRRQCKATFQFDRIGAKLIDDMGAESLMWGSDYPHGDGVWPNSDKYIKEQFAEVSPEVTRMITCTNAGKFYGLIN
jgi:predicted TIM-barrel fold metal-dependent hydrolase